MKKIFLLIFMCSSFLYSKDNEVGRYQVIQVKYNTLIVHKSESEENSSLILLDTVTGKTKQFVSIIDKNKKGNLIQANYWSDFEERK